VHDVIDQMHELGLDEEFLALNPVERALEPHGRTERDELVVVDVQVEREAAPP
jgi:hypothetical protein